MSWLNDRVIQYLYRSYKKDLVVELPSNVDAPDTYEFEGKVYRKIEMLPFKTNLTFKVQFERNGTIGYKYDTGSGKPRVVSATRENYEHNVGNTGGDRVKELKQRGHISRMAPSITSKGYKETFKKVQAKKGGL
jgi:hypothetical protein